MKRIEAYWYSQNPIAWLLLPVTAIYCLLVFFRRFLYRTKILTSYSLPVPVIIVGNISVGGTGKTPLLIALCELLKQQGYRPGIVSRGYSGEFDGEHLVVTSDVPNVIGDEPYLISKRTHCPIVVGQNRVAAAELLLANSNCNLILSDDGLQHYRLRRDIEIAIIDSSRQFGNGFCLPSGPLRETVSRLKQVDLVVEHCTNVNADNKNSFLLKFSDAINLSSAESKTVGDFKSQPVHGVAGIGHPLRFFKQLRTQGLDVIEHDYPDHYKFKKTDFIFNDQLQVLMTEKDAVKCQDFAENHLWYVPVNAELSQGFKHQFLSMIKTCAEKVSA